MRIKIIGDNNCARATRHLLRKAGFAVSEFLPADVIVQAPHSGYAITIDLAPATQPPDLTSKPDHPTHGQPAPRIEEAYAFAGTTAGSPAVASTKAGASSPTSHSASARIHFDSVDSELEAAILRHVTQLASAPVVVDRPGGVVHSERELRIVVPHTNDAEVDEAAAVAVEFGVLRGLLDLVSPPSFPKLQGASADKSAAASSGSRSEGGKKWWRFGLVVLIGALSIFSAEVLAAAQGQFATGQAPVKITDGTNTLVVDPCKAQTKFYVSISQTANTQLVTGTASKKIYICSIHVVVAAATNVALVEGTGSVCATGTAGVSGFGGATAATGWNFMANGGIALGNGDAAVGAEGTNADNLCLFNSGSGQVSGGIGYVVQ
jgi:hypothetical protein